MTTLADIRARVRIDLHDPNGDRWDDDAINRHIARALSDIDRAIPYEQTATLATTPGDRDLSLATLDGLVEVEAVEYPAGEYPPEYVAFSRWQDTLTVQGEVTPAGDDARVYYTRTHTLDALGSTLPRYLEDVLATGAAAYAAFEQAAATSDALAVSGEAPRDFASLGRAWMTAFRQLLLHHARANRVRQRRLYLPA